LQKKNRPVKQNKRQKVPWVCFGVQKREATGQADAKLIEAKTWKGGKKGNPFWGGRKPKNLRGKGLGGKNRWGIQ